MFGTGAGRSKAPSEHGPCRFKFPKISPQRLVSDRWSRQHVERPLVEDESRILWGRPLSRGIEPFKSVPVEEESSPFVRSSTLEPRTTASTPPAPENNLAPIRFSLLALPTPKSIPQRLEGRHRVTMTKGPIPSRELPPLTPSLVPHCFFQKPHHPLTLPRIHTRAIGEATGVGRGRTSAPITPNPTNPCRSPDLEARVVGVHHEYSLPSAGQPGSKKGVNETTRGAAANAPGQLVHFSSSNAAPTSTGLVTHHNISHGHRNENEPGGCVVESRGECTSGQTWGWSSSSPARDGWGPLLPIQQGLAYSVTNPARPPASPVQGVIPHAFESIRASDYPSHYGDYSAKGYSGSYERGSGTWGGGREGGGRDDDDDRWDGGDSGGDEKDRGEEEGDEEDKEDEKGEPSHKKVPRKTPIACYFCRGRKLKCNGGRPTCRNCASRSLVCAYDIRPRRRGPGRKNKSILLNQESKEAQSQEPQPQPQLQPQASTSMESLVGSSSSLYADPVPLPPYSLPAPPPPAYNFPVGQIPRTNLGIGTGSRAPGRASGSAAAGPSDVYGHQRHHRQHDQHMQHAQDTYTQDTQHIQHPQHGRHGHHYQQLPHQQPSRQPPTRQYTHEYAEAQASHYPSQGTVTYRSSRSREEPEYPSEEDEETSRSRSKKRASSPPGYPRLQKRSRDDDHYGRGY